jgi:hypothetical protein
VLLIWTAAALLVAQSSRDSVPQSNLASPDGLSPELSARIPFSGLPRPQPFAPTFGLPQLSQAAGTIFSGQVISVTRAPAPQHTAVEAIAIRFHVENSIRGAIPGQDLTIYQWMGLWSGGQRYRIGERLLVFLYPPSKLGLTSIVGGSLGRFAVDSSGRVLLSDQQLSAFRKDPVLGGKSSVLFRDFARAVQRTRGEE